MHIKLTMKEKELAEKYLVFKCVAGSHSYGTALPDSDMDTRGVFIAPPEYSLGVFKKVEQCESSVEDETIFEFDKFVQLAVACNPNIIELLYTPSENILFIDEPFRRLVENRHLILSTKAKFSFSGYSMAQMKRISGHNRWLTAEKRGKKKVEELLIKGKVNQDWINARFPKLATSEPEQFDHKMDEYLADMDVILISNVPPSLRQFCTVIDAQGGNISKLSEDKFKELHDYCFLVVSKGEYCFRIYRHNDFKPGIISEDGTNFLYHDISDEKLKEKNAEYIGVLLGDKDAFRTERKAYKDYWSWKKNRNPVRAELEEKHGMDGKHASHLVRLMRMCEEILTSGEVIVKRPDAQELLDIRNGKFSYDELMSWAQDQDKKMDELYEKSTLRKYPDLVTLNNLVIDIKLQYWKQKNLM